VPSSLIACCSLSVYYESNILSILKLNKEMMAAVWTDDV